jgi:endoglucanase
MPPLTLLVLVLVLVLPLPDGVDAAAAAAASHPVLRRGWNLGDTLDTEQYNPGVNAPWVFESVKRAGFDWCRIPVHWGPHTAATAPFKVDASFMATVRQTVEWALKAGLVAMINTHHETWLDNRTAFSTQLPRLVSIWEQIGSEFAGVPDADLVFELLNEPSSINISQLNAMNAALLPVVRKSNPTRQVHFGGLAKMGSW